MISRAILVCLALVAAVLMPAAGPVAAQERCSFPLTTTDASGTEVTIDTEPLRVVTLNPSAAQTMWEIGARDKVVGLTKYASYLDGASSKTNVSGTERIIVLERVVALEPDLVLAPNATSLETVAKLREAGLTVYHFAEAESISDVENKVATIGRLVGECEGARETVSWMRQRLAVVDRAVDGRERPTVLYLFFGYTAGEGTFIHEVLMRAGGHNLAAEVGVTGYRQLSEEIVIDRDPEWIVLNSADPALPNSPAVRGTTAAERNQTVVVPIEHINQPAPRVVYAIEALAAAFHPEAYAAANATASTELTDTESPTALETDSSRAVDRVTTTRPRTTSRGQPGFGAASAVIVLVGFALAARVRRE